MKRQNSYLLTVAVVVALAVSLFLTFKLRQTTLTSGSGKVKVVTTLFPLYDMARSIGGAQATVTQLVPPGVEPHSFEPKPSDLVAIDQADIFIYTGKFMEPWVADILKGTTNRHLIVIDASQSTTMIPGVFHDADEPAGSLDPHIWLDFDNAKIMAANIARGLTAAAGTGQDFFQTNLTAYQDRLAALDKEYRQGLANCQNREIVYGGHYAFGYLAHRYGLKYLAAQGVSPDAEPSASDLVSLVDQINQQGVKYVFYEELTSPKIATTLATETKAKLLLLNAAHNLTKEQFISGVTYFDILETDLANLRLGLGCR
jgi:zinc transport system substrate-binding protein